MSDFGFYLGIALLFIMFAPASCKSGDPNLAQSIVAYLDAKAKQ
jgi:hypothetical protein